MDTIRVSGSPVPLDYETIKITLGRCADTDILSTRNALQSTGNHGATVTFRSEKTLTDILERSGIRRDRVLQVDGDFDGITVLCAPQKIDVEIISIIAVHGFGGHAFNSWVYRERDVKTMWLRDILPEEFPTARIMVFGYDSGIFTRSTASGTDLGKALLASLAAKRQYENAQDRPILFVAHSFGGIVVKRKALVTSRNQNIYPEIEKSTQGIIFLGTPHRGSDNAKWGQIISRIGAIGGSTQTEHLNVLRQNSQALLELSDTFLDLAKNPRLQTVSFYETQKMKVKAWKSVKVVEQFSAVMGLQNESSFPLQATHIEMARFQNRSIPACELVLFQMNNIISKSLSPSLGKNSLEVPVPVRPISRCSNPDNNSILADGGRHSGATTVPETLPTQKDLEERTNLLNEISFELQKQDTRTSPAPRCCTLFGLGGQGKSQLALSYMDKHRSRYKYMFFVRADSRPKLAQGFASIARRLNLPGADEFADPKDLQSVVLEWLNTEKNTKWLLTFDNAESAKDLAEFWCAEAQGDILLTTRDANMAMKLPTSSAHIEVRGFSKIEAVDFLIRQTGEERLATTIETCESIARQVGFLPMALMQLSCFAFEHSVSLSKVNQLLSLEGQTGLLSEESDISARYYEHSFKTVWAADLNSLDHNSAAFLNVLCLLDPDHIPGTLFHGRGLGNPFFKSEMEYLRALRPLKKFNILHKSKDDDLEIHRLVQQVQLDRVERADRNEAFENALKAVRTGFPKQYLGMHMNRFWPQCEIFLPHVLSIETAFRQRSFDTSSAVDFVNLICDASWYLFETGQLEEALARLQTADHLCKSLAPSEALHKARVYIGQAIIHAHRNEYQIAGPLYQRAWSIRKRLLGCDDHLLANSYMQVALTYTAENNLHQAIDFHKTAIRIREKASHRAPSLMALSYLNLSRCLMMTKQYEDLDVTLREVELRIGDLEPSERTAFLGGLYYIRGNMKYEQGELDSALNCHHKARELREADLGVHYYTAASYHKTAVVQLALRRNTDALSSLRSALEILNQLKGASISGRLARTEILLSQVLQSHGSGMHAEAQKMRIAAYQHYKDSTGKDIIDGSTVDFDSLVPFIDR
ncbi:phosphorylase superfamily protein [Penicillium coprophilum]|uniref:phosphorylase superfamily protein n=1 Tax=Penicillium coprophilum TaxID=36646 RepID=UPI0023A425FD|nr:phosphorylase superfamily protein [Penicillium coprophilum]KAJ5159113.1 phosphorylase superfamily protein [Penicillium coprophilum]